MVFWPGVVAVWVQGAFNLLSCVFATVEPASAKESTSRQHTGGETLGVRSCCEPVSPYQTHENPIRTDIVRPFYRLTTFEGPCN